MEVKIDDTLFTPINVAIMGPEQIKDYQQMLLNNVFVQKLEHNKKQITIWNEYKNRHKKIIDGLQVYPLSLSENCMIPIGKRALMKGKLTHTNEVLISLGCDYFVKYSASQAIAICNRRITYANEMLKSLEIERNFYEMKQVLPLQHNLFGEKDRKDILEYWNKDELDVWRVKHKDRQKEYYQKLAKLREKERLDDHIEEDFLKRLEELELEEELEDRMCSRFKTEQKQFDDDNLENDEVYDESNTSDTSDSDVITTEMIEEELKKLKKQVEKNEVTCHTKLDFDIIQNKVLNTDPIKNEKSDCVINSDQEKLRINCSLDFKDISESIDTKKVSFIESYTMEDKDDLQKESSVSQRICFVPQDDIHGKDSEDENDIIRIEFSHSSYISNIIKESDIEIHNPGDIYKVFGASKSILKRSPNDIISNHIVSPLHDDNSTIETEDWNDHVRCSVYNSVITKKVQERKIPTDIINNKENSNSKKTNKKEIVSIFKLSRIKKNDI